MILVVISRVILTIPAGLFTFLVVSQWTGVDQDVKVLQVFNLTQTQLCSLLNV